MKRLRQNIAGNIGMKLGNFTSRAVKLSSSKWSHEQLLISLAVGAAVQYRGGRAMGRSEMSAFARNATRRYQTDHAASTGVRREICYLARALSIKRASLYVSRDATQQIALRVRDCAEYSGNGKAEA